MNEQPDFKDTNFEAITPKGAEALVDALPEFQPTESIDDVSDYKLQINDVTSFETEELADEQPEASSPAVIEDEVSADESFETDFKKARANLQSLEDRRDDIINELFSLAKVKQDGRTFEVLADMIDKFADISVRRIDMHEKREKIKASNNTSGSGGKTPAGQATIRMNTNDLLEMLKREDQKPTETPIEGECKPVGSGDD